MNWINSNMALVSWTQIYMLLLILSAAAATAFFSLRLAGVSTYSADRSRITPQIPSLLAGYDNGLLYVLNPRAFLSRCQQRCGSVYRVSLGFRRLVVVSSGDAISSVFSASPQLLRSDVIHQEMLSVVSGVRSNYSRLRHVMIRDLFPLVDRSFSMRSLGQTTQTFGIALLSQIKNFVHNHSGPMSLMHLTNEPLYNVTNLVLLGSAFPIDTYGDFRTLNKSVPYRFGRTLLWFWPSYSARIRLLNSISHYLQRGEAVDCNDEFSLGFMKSFKKNDIQSFEGAQLVLSLLWAIHSNTLNNSFFLVVFLLTNLDAFARVRAEVDLAVEKFGSLQALLEACPSELDDPSFKLLTSAIMETMRLTGLHAGMRLASCDFVLRVNDETIPIRKGEYVSGNIYAAHMDATVFPNPETFVVDRFAQHPYQRRHLQTDVHFFHSLGGGRHICKGRWLAVYEIKVLSIILLRMFDFSPAKGNSGGWHLPRVHPRSIGVTHTEDDVFVRLSPREVEADWSMTCPI